MPVAYLWTRTVKCKNPACGAIVPLVKQTWLCKKEGRYVAMKMIAPTGKKQVRFEVVEAKSEKGLGFDPEAFSQAGNATCPFCGAVADSEYVKSVGHDLGYGQQPMAIVCVRPGRQGKVYIDADTGVLGPADLEDRERNLSARGNIPLLTEAIEANPRSFDVHRYGFLKWAQVFTAKQRVTLMAVAVCLRDAWKDICSVSGDDGRACGLYTATALSFSRLVTHQRFLAGALRASGVGGTRPPRLAPGGGNGKGGDQIPCAAGYLLHAARSPLVAARNGLPAASNRPTVCGPKRIDTVSSRCS